MNVGNGSSWGLIYVVVRPNLVRQIVKIAEIIKLNYFKKQQKLVLTFPYLRHRGLKLDGAIGQGEICNSLKSEKFSKSFLFHIGKNKIKF